MHKLAHTSFGIVGMFVNTCITGWLISPRSLDAYNYIGTMKKERILVLDLLKKHLEKAGK